MKEADYFLEPRFSKDDWPLITEETTLKDIREIHKRIWDYVIENGGNVIPRTCTIVHCASMPFLIQIYG